VEVRPENLLAMATPQIGHRTPEFGELYASINEKLKKMLATEGLVFIFTSSATGVWEAAVRNTIQKKCLNTICGAFSKRWHAVTKKNGKDCDVLEVEWGKAITPEMVDKELASGEYDTITLVLNETSTGVMNPVKEISQMIRKKYPDVLVLVDAVSAMGGIKMDIDDWGVDVCLSGMQKAFGLPSGITVCTVSDRAMKRAEQIEDRGYYFDFMNMLKYHKRNQTPSTPAIPHLFALDAQLTDILEEGVEAREERHKSMAETVQKWAKDRGFELFAEEGYESWTLTCVKNTKGFDIPALNKELAKHDCMISNGYGDLKGKAFRIAHMADTQRWEILGLLALIDEIWELG
jgi:predicted phosphoserine aminotransferase